jgi:hypothetical protein
VNDALAFGDQIFAIGGGLHRVGTIRQPIVAQDNPLIGQAVAGNNRYHPSRPSFLATRSRRPCTARDTTHSCAVSKRQELVLAPFSLSPAQVPGLLQQAVGGQADEVVMLLFRVVGDVTRHRRVTHQIAADGGVVKFLDRKRGAIQSSDR